MILFWKSMECTSYTLSQKINYTLKLCWPSTRKPGRGSHLAKGDSSLASIYSSGHNTILDDLFSPTPPHQVNICSLFSLWVPNVVWTNLSITSLWLLLALDPEINVYIPYTVPDSRASSLFGGAFPSSSHRLGPYHLLKVQSSSCILVTVWLPMLPTDAATS